MGNSRYMINQQQSISRINSKLLYISTSKYEGDWQCNMHTHYFTELFYIISGSGSVIVEDQTFSVKEDDMIIINPDIEHTEKSYNESPLEYFVLGIEGLAFNFNKQDALSEYSIYNFSNHKKTILYYLNTILIEIEDQNMEYEFVCQNLLEILLIQIMRLTHFNLVPTSLNVPQKNSKECSKIKRYINSHYSEDITLQKLADITHMNKFHLIHAFTKYTGVSPINYLNNKRIEESKNLLVTTDYSVAVISSEVGFSSQSYFSQAFRKSTGISPNEYRKAHKQLNS